MGLKARVKHFHVCFCEIRRTTPNNVFYSLDDLFGSSAVVRSERVGFQTTNLTSKQLPSTRCCCGQTHFSQRGEDVLGQKRAVIEVFQVDLHAAKDLRNGHLLNLFDLLEHAISPVQTEAAILQRGICDHQGLMRHLARMSSQYHYPEQAR